MKIAYSFSVLRYAHDPVTQEIINIGVAVFSPDAKYVRAICTANHRAITNIFERIESALLEKVSTIEELLAMVLASNDRAIQFSKSGIGSSAGDLDRTLRELFQRHVERYSVGR